MIYPNTSAALREDIAAVIVQGRGINALNIGQQVLPAYGVNRKNGHLLQLGIAGMEMMRIMDKIIAPGGDVERITLTFDGTTYALAIRKEEALLPDEITLEFEDYFPTEVAAGQILNNKLELTHEYLTAAAIFNTTTFGAATNSAVAYTAANLATISLIADIKASIRRVRAKGEVPNTVIIPGDVLSRAVMGTLVINYVTGQLGAGKDVNQNTLQAALKDEGITKVLIADSVYNNAAKNAAPSLVKIWSNSYIWVGRTSDTATASEDGVETVDGVGATLFWEAYGRRMVQTYRAEERESNVLRAKTSEVPTVLNANAGDLIATQYA